jgi:hypothetical protein
MFSLISLKANKLAGSNTTVSTDNGYCGRNIVEKYRI